ncbi:MAG: DNA polymerase I [Bdellovibrionaceae bacterium]|nr:DNA polymerase I [Pseudobdellovibrionaceae bacterium]
MKKLYLVDVSSMFFRAYYAVRPLSTSQGLPTNAIYGFLSMVVKLLKEIKPDYVAFCFDRPEPSFRKDIYEEYKANRSEMPEDLVPQVPYIKKLTEALGIPMFEQAGFEADDIIGTLAQLHKNHKLDVVIVSGDKDFSQLINKHVTMLDTMKDKLFDEKEVKEKWGVTPQQFIDYLAITGDTSDNIPGVRGVGPKGAEKLLAEYKDLEDIYAHIEDIKNPNIQKKLLESKEMAFTSKILVTIKTDMKLTEDLQDLKLRGADEKKLAPLLQELEFESFKKNLIAQPTEGISIKDEPSHEKTAPTRNEKISSLEHVKEWLKKVAQPIVLSHNEQLLFADEKDVHILNITDTQVGEDFVVSHKSWIGFDLKHVWRTLNISSAQSVEWDGMLDSYVLRAGQVGSFFDVQKMFDGGYPLTESASASEAIDALLHLRGVLQNKLKELHMDQITKTIEYPLVDILTAMEEKGVLIDVDFLKKESLQLEKEIHEIEQKIHKLSGEEFNIASPKQLGQILFEKLKLPTGKKTKTGYSTNSDVLEALAHEYPIAQEIINYRELAKLKSTYVDALPGLVNAKTGRVHTQLNQAVTATGRLSSTNPNLQNIPIRTERGMRIRKAFVAPKSYMLLSADYSQIELRVLAHISQDKNLRKAFQEDQDIHAATASEIFEVPLDRVTSDLRRKAKAVNFGIAYGQGAFGLAQSLGIPRAESREIIDRYFKRFPGVRKYMDEAIEQVKDKGYVETILGRRRYIPEIHSKNHALKAFAERAAINAPIQGMSSDLVKLAMIEVAHKYRNDLLLQVHDELIFELKDDSYLEDKANDIKALMEGCMTLDVPLKVNISLGKSWADL